MNCAFYDHILAGTLIERYCAAHNIKEQDYAALIGVHPASLSRIKAGKACSPEVLAKIAALGKTSLRSLVKESPESIKTELFATGREKNIPVCV